MTGNGTGFFGEGAVVLVGAGFVVTAGFLVVSLTTLVVARAGASTLEISTPLEPPAVRLPAGGSNILKFWPG